MIGHSIDDSKTALEALMKKIGATNVDDVLRYLGGKATQGQVMAETGKTLNALTLGKAPKTVGRMAGSKIGRGIARAVPALSALSNVGEVADIVAGDDSFGNKAMDATAFTAGGAIGGLLGGPLGASVGASIGKTASDGIQGLVGGGKSAEERKLEEALIALRGGNI